MCRRPHCALIVVSSAGLPFGMIRIITKTLAHSASAPLSLSTRPTNPFWFFALSVFGVISGIRSNLVVNLIFLVRFFRSSRKCGPKCRASRSLILKAKIQNSRFTAPKIAIVIWRAPWLTVKMCITAIGAWIPKILWTSFFAVA